MCHGIPHSFALEGGFLYRELCVGVGLSRQPVAYAAGYSAFYRLGLIRGITLWDCLFYGVMGVFVQKGDESFLGLVAAVVAAVGLALTVEAQGRCGGSPGTEGCARGHSEDCR